ncbi:MAG: DUF11 domain-containing protein, partial [bacterium]|nr:DUF11 domain-containing protein [bacterium]
DQPEDAPGDESDSCDVDVTNTNTPLDLGITKTTTETSVVPAVAFDYTITVVNNEVGMAATGVVVTDIMAANLIYNSDTCGGGLVGDTWTWAVGGLAAAGSDSCVLNVQPTGDASGTVENTATVASDNPDSTPGDNSDTVILPVQEADVGVSVSTDATAALSPGDTLVVSVELTNYGPYDATNIQIAATIDPNFTYVSDTCSGDFGDGIWDIGGPVGTSALTVVCHITLTAGSSLGSFCGYAEILAVDQFDPDLDNNVSDTVCVGVVEHTGSDGTCADGNPISYATSEAPGGPAYSFVDISGTGTAIPLEDEDEATIGIGFTFEAFSATDVRVANNGALIFGAGLAAGTPNAALPYFGSPAIAVHWDDIAGDTQGGGVYYETFATCPNTTAGVVPCLVVQWNDRPRSPGNGAATFEAIIFGGSDGYVLTQYEDVDFSYPGRSFGETATVGLEGDGFTLQYAFNAAGSLQNGMAILYDLCVIPPAPVVCQDVAAGAGVPIPFDFGIPSDWTVVDNEGTGLVWTNLAGSGEGNYTSGSGDAATASSDSAGPVDYDTELWTNSFSTVGFPNVYVNYGVNYQNYGARDFLDLDVSVDGGTSWTTVLSWNEDHPPGGLRLPPGEDVVEFDISAVAANQASVILRWHYYDPVANWDWYAQIDDFWARCADPPPPPEIDVDPLSMASTLAPDMTEIQTLTIANTGGSPLDWTIDEDNLTIALPPMPRQVGEGDPSQAAEGLDAPNIEAPEPEGRSEPWHAPRAVLYDNGPLVNCPGCGDGGADESQLQTALGLTTLGFGVQASSGNRLADEFTVTHASGWSIDEITFFAYQTGSPTTSSITAVNLQIWDGSPDDPASSVVFGDTTTNRMASSAWSNIYRVTDTTSGSTSRPIMAAVVTVGTLLPPGTYWLDWQVDGSLASGPWAPPITIDGVTDTGNALQYTGTWGAALSDIYQQGFPFIIDGTGTGAPSPCLSASDIPWLSLSDTSGTTPVAGSSPVSVTYDSAGMAAGTYNAYLCVYSNDPDPGPGNGTELVPVSVELIVDSPSDPAIELTKTVGITPGVCAATDVITVTSGTAVTYCYHVENTGNVSFAFHDLEDDQLGTLLANFPQVLLPGGTYEHLETTTIMASVLNQGTWTAKQSVGGFTIDDTIPHDFLDISATGTPFTLGDDSTLVLPIGFSFDYYGLSYTDVEISSNGFLTVNQTGDSGCCTGDPLPDPTLPNGVIAGWWEDLDAGEA